MQAIHNSQGRNQGEDGLFQRAKIQVKCKQFTTSVDFRLFDVVLFQRAKIQVKCKQFTTGFNVILTLDLLFQRAKIQVKCKQFTTNCVFPLVGTRCFKGQRYKLNASNSQLLCMRSIQPCVVSKGKDTS